MGVYVHVQDIQHGSKDYIIYFLMFLVILLIFLSFCHSDFNIVFHLHHAYFFPLHGYVATPTRISNNYLCNDFDGSRQLWEIDCMAYNDISTGSGLVTNGYIGSSSRVVRGLVDTISHVIKNNTRNLNFGLVRSSLCSLVSVCNEVVVTSMGIFSVS